MTDAATSACMFFDRTRSRSVVRAAVLNSRMS